MNKLHPGIVSQPWTLEEDQKLLQAFHEFGSKWSQIAKYFPQRSQVMIKNRFNQRFKHLLTSRRGERLPEAEESGLKNWQYKRKIVTKKVNQLMQIMNEYRRKGFGPGDKNLFDSQKNENKNSICLQKASDRSYEDMMMPSKTSMDSEALLKEQEQQELSELNNSMRKLEDQFELEMSSFQRGEVKEELPESDLQIKAEAFEEETQKSAKEQVKLEENGQIQQQVLNALMFNQYFRQSGLPLIQIKQEEGQESAKPQISVEECKKRIELLRSDLPKLELMYAQSLQQIMLCLSSLISRNLNE